LIAYRDFQQDTADVPAGADPDDAARRLSAVLEREITGDTVARVSNRGVSESWFSRFFRALSARPAYSLALLLVVVVAAGVVFLRPGLERGGETLLRGGPGSGKEFVLQPAEVGLDGQWTLRWTPVKEADSYEIRIYSAELEQIGGIGPLTGTIHLISPDDLGLELPAGTTVFWRVFALRRGDIVAASPVETIEIP
jgi:hypothetical protein